MSVVYPQNHLGVNETCSEGTDTQHLSDSFLIRNDLKQGDVFFRRSLST
jgi:hypothetical protein